MKKVPRGKWTQEAPGPPRPRPNKLLGQHFLIRRDVLSSIIAAADIGPDEYILEVGPGRGILTRELARRAKAVVAVEKDPRLATELRETIAAEHIANVRIETGDILKIQKKELASIFMRSHKNGNGEKYEKKRDEAKKSIEKSDKERGNGKRKGGVFSVVANIPYYITGRFIRNMLEDTPRPEKMTIMVQREVAERISAEPPEMNLLGLSVQAFGRPRIAARVPASAFQPQPKVDSAIITITDISLEKFHRHGITTDAFFAIARRAFSGRRKILENTLGAAYGKTLIENILSGIGFAKRRPQELGIKDWLTLVSKISDRIRT